MFKKLKCYLLGHSWGKIYYEKESCVVSARKKCDVCNEVKILKFIPEINR